MKDQLDIPGLVAQDASELMKTNGGAGHCPRPDPRPAAVFQTLADRLRSHKPPLIPTHGAY